MNLEEVNRAVSKRKLKN